jgi:hypothetical protein
MSYADQGKPGEVICGGKQIGKETTSNECRKQSLAVWQMKPPADGARRSSTTSIACSFWRLKNQALYMSELGERMSIPMRFYS